MVYFIGAGPGDPELLTVKGLNILKKADVVIYAGSLVNPEILKYTKDGCEIYNSAVMNLEQITEIAIIKSKEGKIVARLHTGDPSIYGAILEQMVILEKNNVEYEIIPGVSSFCAAASRLKIEYTVPELAQTVVITRESGQTVVPEDIVVMARQKPTLIFFLSVHLIDSIVEKLSPIYGIDSKVAVVYKATWKEEKIITGTFEDIAQKVRNSGIKETALIIVGKCLERPEIFSKLYDKTFSHKFRGGTF